MSEMYKLKFESLVSEYRKLLTHLKVLKKGYTDSRAKVTDLTELVKQKDKSLRKNEIEIESLNFRNQQLTKRISVLQIDLDSFEKKSSKKSHVTHNSCNNSRSNTDAVLQEELQKRIAENSKLACQIEDIQHELGKCKEMLNNKEKSQFETEMKYKCHISRLKHQNQTQKRTQISQASFDGDSCSDGGIEPDSIVLDDDKNFMQLNDFFLSSEDVQLQTKLRKYEQENRRLKMEFEVLKMENESLKIANKKQNVIKAEGRSRCDSSEDEIWEHPVWHNEEGVLTSYVGKLSVPFKIDDEIRKREENIIKFFRKEISRIIVEKQQSDSLIDLYAAECEALTLRTSWMDFEKHISTEQNI